MTFRRRVYKGASQNPFLRQALVFELNWQGMHLLVFRHQPNELLLKHLLPGLALGVSAGRGCSAIGRATVWVPKRWPDPESGEGRGGASPAGCYFFHTHSQYRTTFIG